MKDHTTAEIFEELWKRMEYDAQVSEELASESNKLQDRINKVLEYIDVNYLDFTYVYSKNEDLKCIHLENLKDILKGVKE